MINLSLVVFMLDQINSGHIYTGVINYYGLVMIARLDWCWMRTFEAVKKSLTALVAPGRLLRL